MSSHDQAMTFLAVADVEVVDDEPERHFDHVRSLFHEADLVFGQLEVPLANSGPPQLGGGIRNWGHNKDARAGAKVLESTGFHVMSHAGNHTMDMSEETLFETIDAVAKETDIKLIGVGRTLAGARAPAIVEIGAAKVGFLAYCSVPIKNAWAEDRMLPNGRHLQRGGINPLRAHTYYEDIDYQPGNLPRIVTETYQEDLEAMKASISALRPQVDVVAVSMHWGIHFKPADLAMYQVEAGHAAVDSGADVVLGHHPHTIKGIEYYGGKPILYGMPNFNLGIRDEHEEPDPRFLTRDSEKSFIAKFEISSGRITRFSLIPCHLDYSTRQPEPLKADDPRAQDIVKYLEYVDRHNFPDYWAGTGAARAYPPFDTVYRFDGDEIVVEPRAGS